MRNFKIVLAILLPIQVLLFQWIKNNETWVENTYIPLIFNNISFFLRQITSPIAFSVGLSFIYLCLIFIIFYLAFSIKKKKIGFSTLILNIFSFTSVIYLFFMLTWGLAYHRKPIAQIKNLDTENIKATEIEALCKELITKTNELRLEITNNESQNSSVTQYFKQAKLGYHELAKANKEFALSQESIKPMIANKLMSWINTAGIYTFWSGEANINENMANFEAPFVICHEIAHQLGFASEDEANYLSYLACEANSEKIFKYSANSQALRYTLNALFELDSTQYYLYKNQINKSVLEDWAYSKKIKSKYNAPILEAVSSFFYDLFLKSNSQSQGIKSYGLVVELLVGDRRKNKINSYK